MSKKKKLSTFKAKKPLERKVADKLVDTHQKNEKLREKKLAHPF